MIKPDDSNSYRKDSIEKQILYNGRVWRNIYYKVLGDQFLFSNEFLPGSVTISGKVFNNLRLKYDIYKDEILTLSDHQIILQLNKEIIDSFTLGWGNGIYHFQRLDRDSLNSLSGYVNVLFNGNSTSLYVKYRKEILLLAVDNKFDTFNQLYHIYLKKDGKIYQIVNRHDFLKLLSDKKMQVRSFIRSNKIHVTRKDPASFTSIVEYYDKLQH